MRITLIISAHNEGDLLWKTVETCVEICGSQHHEILVANDASRDGSIEEMQKRFPTLRVVSNQRREGASATKHLGAQAASGDVLIFLDGHCKPESGSIERMIEAVERTEGRAVITPTIASLDVRKWKNSPHQVGHGYFVDLEDLHCGWLALNELRPHDADGRIYYESPSLIGCAMAVTKDLYDDVRGFDPHMRLWGVEDLDFALKCWLLGYQVLHDPHAVIGHRFQQTFDHYTVPADQLLANQLRMARKNYTDGVWNVWLAACRDRNQRSFADHPEGLWARTWSLFQEHQSSAEHERSYLFARRKHDEFWFAERFGLKWPKLLSLKNGNGAPKPAAPAAATGPISLPAPAAEAPRSAGTPESPSQSQPMGESQPLIESAAMPTTPEFMLEVPAASPSPSPSPSPPPPWFVNYRPPCDPPCQCPAKCNGVVSNACDSGASPKPVRYATGEVVLSVVDLSSDGFGATWQHRRVYSNQFEGNLQAGQGYRWLVFNWPYLEFLPAIPGVRPAMISYIRGTEGTLWFQVMDEGYQCMFGGLANLTHDVSAMTFTLTQPSGYVQVFNDFTLSLDQPGRFIQQIEPGGQVTSVTNYNANHQIVEIQRSSTIAGVTTIESFLYAYTADYFIASVTLRRKVGGAAWSNIRQAVYSYYSYGDPNGSYGDLELVEIQLPSGSGWIDFEQTYYRYYTSEVSPGFVYGLKYVIEPASYQAMVADGFDPATASDAQLSIYADYGFQYDDFQRVTVEQVYRGSQTYTYSYTAGTGSSDFNVWGTKTVETMPDGTQNVVYTNFIGQFLVKAFVSGTESWIEAWQYDLNGREVLYAQPSAVIGYDDSFSNLAVEYQAASGLIRNTNYYASDSGGGARGYPQNITIQQGSGGTSIQIRGYTYSPYSIGGIPIYPIATDTEYRNIDGTGAIFTLQTFSYYPGTTQRQLQYTELPSIATSQNGSGIPASTQAFFDIWDRPIWLMDERGFITQKTYDQATGALIQQIDDVNTSIVSGAPTGWTTPLGGGLNLQTDYQIDDLGRTTRILEPSHVIDLDGVATTIRTATWFVYQDATYQT